MSEGFSSGVNNQVNGMTGNFAGHNEFRQLRSAVSWLSTYSERQQRTVCLCVPHSLLTC